MSWFRIVLLCVWIVLTAGSWYVFRTHPRRGLMRRGSVGLGIAMIGLSLMSLLEGLAWLLLVPVVLVALWVSLSAIVRVHREQNEEALERYREKQRAGASGA